MKPAASCTPQKPMSAPRAKNDLTERLRENHDQLMAELNNGPAFHQYGEHDQVSRVILLALQRSTVESLPGALCPLLP